MPKLWEHQSDSQTDWNSGLEVVYGSALQGSDVVSSADAETQYLPGLSGVVYRHVLITGENYITASKKAELIWQASASKIRRSTRAELEPVGRQSQLDQWFMRRKEELTRQSVKTLLTELSRQYGLPWVDIARYARVSVPAVRKWRMEGQPSPEKVAALVNLTATMEAAEREGIADPARWLFTPISENVTISPGDIMQMVSVPEFLSILARVHTAEYVLDRKQSDWRERYYRRYKVQVDGHGDGAIIRD